MQSLVSVDEVQSDLMQKGQLMKDDTLELEAAEVQCGLSLPYEMSPTASFGESQLLPGMFCYRICLCRGAMG